MHLFGSQQLSTYTDTADLLMFKLSISDFECDVVVGARRAGLSVSETDYLLGFSHTSISKVYRERSRRRENIQ